MKKKVWIGEGLPAIPKKVYEKSQTGNLSTYIVAELKPAGTLDAINPDPDPDPEKYIILPGLEIARGVGGGEWEVAFAAPLPPLLRVVTNHNTYK